MASELFLSTMSDESMTTLTSQNTLPVTIQSAGDVEDQIKNFTD